MIDYGPEADLQWVCFQDDTGECWTWLNKDIRLQENMTLSAIRQKVVAKIDDAEKCAIQLIGENKNE